MPKPEATINDRLLDHGEGLILAFPTQESTLDAPKVQTAVSTVEAFFFKVSRQIPLRRDYTQLGSFNSGGSNDYAYLGDTGHGTGEDILRIENNPFIVYHFGLGLETTALRVYEKIDPSTPNRPVDHSNQNAPDPTVPSSFGFYDGKEVTDTFDPSAVTERVAFRSGGGGEFLLYGFHAEESIPDGNTDLHILGRTYWLKPVTDPEEQRLMMSQAISEPEDPTLKTTMVQIGNPFGFTLGEAAPQPWREIDALSQTLQFTTPERTPQGGGSGGPGQQASGLEAGGTGTGTEIDTSIGDNTMPAEQPQDNDMAALRAALSNMPSRDLQKIVQGNLSVAPEAALNLGLDQQTIQQVARDIVQSRP